MFANSSTRFKRVWKIRCKDKTHTLTIFPPCAFRTILELIENSFQMKWPFTICDGDGVPTILSDCLESGVYTLKEPVTQRNKVKNRYEHNKQWIELGKSRFNLYNYTIEQITKDEFWNNDFLKFNSFECKTKCTTQALQSDDHAVNW